MKFYFNKWPLMVKVYSDKSVFLWLYAGYHRSNDPLDQPENKMYLFGLALFNINRREGEPLRGLHYRINRR